MNLNKLSSPEEKKALSEIVYEKLVEYFFEKVNFCTLIFTEAKQLQTYTVSLDGGGTVDIVQEVPVTSTSNFSGVSRITDTSDGKYMDVGRDSRMRCSFYLSNPDQLEGYILSPAVYDSYNSLNTISSLNILRSYVGIKFVKGQIQVVSKEAGGSEQKVNTGLSLTGAGATDTWTLEIKFNITSSEIFINGQNVASVPSSMIGVRSDTKTFLPLLSPAKSLDGSAVGIVIENFQFIQSKQ